MVSERVRGHPGATGRTTATTAVARELAPLALPLDGPRDWDPLLARIGDARVVLLGEASHGTHEFYALRAELTRRLILEKGFSFVAVEADWPDAYRVNRWVKASAPADRTAEEALASFRRFPLWMWRNRDVVHFAGWLRAYDQTVPAAQRVGFYGLDLYSLHGSIEAVISYLDRVDPPAAKQARVRYGCLDHADEPQEYGLGVKLGVRPACRDEAVSQLVDLRRRALDYLARDGMVAEDEQLFAEQNARLVVAAEEYYREMFGHRVNTWNLRDRHMASTLAQLLDHHERRRSPAKAVVWEHNSHVGDARATQRTDRDELNVGQLARERWGEGTFNVGFTTHHGTVTAASDWGAPVERKRVRPALPGGIEDVLHAVVERAGKRRLLLPLWTEAARAALAEPRLERAIGVIYRPETERFSHYFHADVPRQFDALVHVDVTHALEPLDRTSLWDAGEPEAWPTGL